MPPGMPPGMPQGQGAPPAFIDPGNPLLAKVPARLDAGTIDIPGQGRVAVVTIRTASTTVSVVLTGDELGQWSEIIRGLHASMGGAISGLVIPTPVEAAAIRGSSRHQRG
jgi:hypothetical protein